MIAESFQQGIRWVLVRVEKMHRIGNRNPDIERIVSRLGKCRLVELVFQYGVLYLFNVGLGWLSWTIFAREREKTQTEKDDMSWHLPPPQLRRFIGR
jgi:hypothetical protein